MQRPCGRNVLCWVCSRKAAEASTEKALVAFAVGVIILLDVQEMRTVAQMSHWGLERCFF